MRPTYQYREFGIFRLFLAVCVLFQHVALNVGPDGRFRTVVAPWEIGSVAVLVFFCLSGFVIMEAASQVYSSKPLAYLVNRLLRIVPHYTVAVAIGIGLHALFFALGSLRSFDRTHPELVTTHMFEPANLAVNFVAFLPGTSRLMNFEYVGVIWAVRVEMVFYIVVFLCLLLPVRLRGFLDRLTVVVLIATFFGMTLISRQLGFLYFFLYGVLLYDYRRHKWHLAACIAGMSAYTYLIPVQADGGYIRSVCTQYVSLILLIGVMTWLGVRSGRYRRIDKRCGDLTYPLYVYHEDFIVLVLSLANGYTFAAMAAASALAIVGSYGLMRAVDAPVNRLRDVIRGERLQTSVKRERTVSPVGVRA